MGSTAIAVVITATAATTADLPFTSGWHFHRGDGNFIHRGDGNFIQEDPSSTTSSSPWLLTDLPHDWSSFDLPTDREADVNGPVLAVRQGHWKFFEGAGNESFADEHFDDSSWRTVAVPNDWRDYGYVAKNATAWYRRTFEVTPLQLAAKDAGLRLALGDVSVADKTYVNGIQIGGRGQIGSDRSCKDALTFRSYIGLGKGKMLSDAIKLGTNVVAVQVWSPGGPKPPLNGSGRSDLKFVSAIGALPAGNDVLPARTMQVADAIKLCNKTIACYGVTFAGKASLPTEKVKVYFKAETVANGDATWHSWVADLGKAGGLVDQEAQDMRVGAFDAGASPGQRQTGYTVGGVGWYRKDFATPPSVGTPSSSSSSSLYVFIEGCYMNCQVFLNNAKVGEEHPYGYTSFARRLPLSLLRRSIPSPSSSSSSSADDEKPNSLFIRVNNNGSNSRWYSGAGLFRPVSLHEFAPLHIAPFWEGGVHVTTPKVGPLVSGSRGKMATSATANVTVTLRNDGAAFSQDSDSGDTTTLYVVVTITEKVSGRVMDAQSVAVPAIAANSSSAVSLSLSIGPAHTWSPDQPFLYEASARLGTQPAQNTTFGVRTFSFDATSGLILNGEPIKLRGGCAHHDNGPLGSRAIGRAEERRVELLKKNGYNAIRTSHNPVSRAFVAACETIGIILMEEAFDTWRDGKNPDDYHLYFDQWWRRDIESMVLRDRNSPSILLWSIGNEIGMHHTPEGVALSKQLADYVRAVDPSPAASKRAITSAVPGPAADNLTDGFFAPLDVAGYNYAYGSYKRDHPRVPSRVMVATETVPRNIVENYKAAFDPTAPYVIGSFIWTAIDYIGESAIGHNGHYAPSPLACGDYCAMPWPYHVSYCGDIDLVGELKPQSRLRRVIWNASKLELSVHRPGAEVIGNWGFRDERQSWTWPGMPSATTLTVRAYAGSGCVKLTLNGQPVAASRRRRTSSSSLTVVPVGAMGGEEEDDGEEDDDDSDGIDGGHCVNVSASTDFAASFDVPYTPGVLQAALHASAAASDPALATVTFKTTGPPAALQLTTDRASLATSRDDLSYLRAELVDAGGSRVECGTFMDDMRFNLTSPPFVPPAWCAPVKIHFKVEGDAELAAVGTGDPLDLSSFLASERDTYRGTATAIVRPGKTGAMPSAGKVTVTASAAGLKSASIVLNVA